MKVLETLLGMHYPRQEKAAVRRFITLTRDESKKTIVKLSHYNKRRRLGGEEVQALLILELGTRLG
jgi:hypothetical protein